MSGAEEGDGGGAAAAAAIEGKQMNNSNNNNSSNSSSSSSSSSSSIKMLEDLQRKVKESKDTSAIIINNFQHKYSDLPYAISVFKSYENAFFTYLKDGLMSVKEHPTAAIGVGASAALLLFRGPRRFLFRHTLGRLQSEEAQFLRAEKNVKEFNLSVDLVKKESKKLLERAALAEKDMKLGYDELMDAGSKIQNLARSVYKAENQAADLMEELREIPGREALKLRAEVASMVSLLKQQRSGLDKRIMKISERGIPV